jgi:lysophospholipase L1-like esterase
MRQLATGLVLASLALASCTHTPETTAFAPGSRYVSMGSSFAAGAGIGPTRPGTPERCGRTTNNYASLLADKLKLTLDDQGCGGATTEHVLGPWDEVPAQIDAVTPDTRLVTLTIGGNDLNYVSKLFGASCSPEGKSLISPAESCGEVTPTGPEDYARTEENLRAIANEVKRRAPSAVLLCVQYVSLVPDELCEAVPLSEQSADRAREIASKLSAFTSKVAQESSAILLPADELSRAHAPCDTQPWATGFPPDYDRSAGAPWHPNAAGHAAIADALAERLGA